MFRAFGAALTLALTLLVLRLALPEVGELLVKITVKLLLLASNLIDRASPPLT